MKFRSILAASSLSGALLAGGTPALAATGSPQVPQICPADPGYSYTGVSSYRYNMVPPSSAPGGHTLSIAISRGLTVTGTVGGQVEGDIGAIVAGAKASVNASISRSKTASVTYTDTWTVPKGWAIGFLHAGAQRDRMHWTYGHYSGACVWIVVRRGTANLPWHIPHFWSTR